jgi:hypothetical protein
MFCFENKTWKMSRITIAVLILGAAGFGQAYAGSCTPVSPRSALPAYCGGSVKNVIADPNDGVFDSDTKGSCGDTYFTLPRATANFKEVFAVMLTTFSTTRNFWVVVASCAGTRNVIDRAGVMP